MYAVLLLSSLAFADNDGFWSLLGASGYAGTVTINNATGSSLFYWQFNSLQSSIFTDTRPLVLWLQGGPGCAGESGMLGERISPLFIDDAQNPHFNNLTWGLYLHLIEVDFPLNAGFSYATTPNDLVNNTVGAVSYLYSFLQRLSVKYPSWFNRDFYIFGESYAGHWVPALAFKIYNENLSANVTGNTVIRLKGIGIGDPLGDALYQTSAYDTYAYDLGLTNLVQKADIMTTESLIVASINQGNYVAANNYMNQVEDQLELYSNNVSLYNIRVYTYEDMGDYEDWLNQAATKTLLRAPSNITWQDCNNDIFLAFSADITAGFISTMMPTLISNMKVMIYNGQDDLIINVNGVENWISNFKWPYISNFLASRRGAWNVAGNIAGYVQTFSNLTFVQVLKAGHFVPFDQQIAARDMVYRFIFNQGWN
jgi:carboxypeptidase C (cathepsin A)